MGRVAHLGRAQTTTAVSVCTDLPDRARELSLTKIRAIVFDMDGVLIDAREWHYEALNQALGLLGFSISRFDHLSTYDGLPTRRKLEMLSMERGLPRALHDFINALKQEYTIADRAHGMQTGLSARVRAVAA